jgi:hypothetical protein
MEDTHSELNSHEKMWAEKTKGSLLPRSGQDLACID